jgi:hypothetical protein
LSLFMLLALRLLDSLLLYTLSWLSCQLSSSCS